jgi:hypothetical protein
MREEVISSNFFLSYIAVSGPDEVSELLQVPEHEHVWLLSATCEEAIHINAHGCVLTPAVILEGEFDKLVAPLCV